MVGVHDATAEPSLLMSPGWDGGGGVCRRESNVSGNNKNKGGLSGKEEWLIDWGEGIGDKVKMIEGLELEGGKEETERGRGRGRERDQAFGG